MPGGDRTGPDGFGAMSGRALGYCAGNSAPAFRGGRGGLFGRGSGRGFFLGRGRGLGYGIERGFRNRFFSEAGSFYGRAEFTKDEELEILKRESKIIQDEMNAVNKRITELENSGSKS